MGSTLSASGDKTVDVVALIDKTKLTGLQVRVITLCAVVAMLDGFDAQAIAFVAPILAGHFSVNISTFGPVFASGLVGMTLGALIIGPFADRVGRKKIVIGSTFAFGLLTLVTALADSMQSLMVYRLLTGLGLGAAMPNVIALTSEYSPKRMGAMLVTVMFVGFPFGAVIGGLISAAMIPLWGWKSVFVLGGVLPILMCVLLVSALPESIRYLVHKGQESNRIASILGRIAPDANVTADTKFIIAEEVLHGVPVRHLFTNGRAGYTLLLWVPFFMNLLLLFFMYNWLPPVLQQAGLPVTRAIIATVLFNLGGVIGGIILARMIDKLGPFGVLTTAYALGAIAVASVGMFGTSLGLIMTAVFVSGFFVIGAQFGINALAASFYPTSVRSTGVGWALGVGRIGSIIGPLLGGMLLALKWPPAQLFIMAAVPAAIAALSLFILRYIAPASARGTDA